MTDSEIFAEQIFGFHAHQIAEKVLKAWIAALGLEYPYTHDLSALLRVIEGSGAKVEHLRDLAEYNPFAVQFRYEAFDWSGEALDRTASLVRLRALVEEIQGVVAGNVL